MFGPASVHTRATTPSHRVPWTFAFNLHNNGPCMQTSLLSSLLLVCTSVFTGAPRQGLSHRHLAITLRHVHESNRQSVTQSDKETPARECKNDCVLRGHLGLLRNSSRLPLPVKTWSQPKSLLGRHEVLQPSAYRPLHLHFAPPASLVSVCHSLLFSAWIMVHGSLHSQYTTASLQLGKGKPRVESQFPTDNMPVTCSSRPISTVGTSGDGILFCYGRLLPRI